MLAAAGVAFYSMDSFRGKDAWDDQGTSSVHANPEGAAKTVTGSGLGM